MRSYTAQCIAHSISRGALVVALCCIQFAASRELEHEHDLELELETSTEYFPHLPPTQHNFPCDRELGRRRAGEPKATSVHALRPGDVEIVAAMGDSITAALGERSATILTDPIEWRGSSWSIGGDDSFEQMVTLPNILKEFNSAVTGYSKSFTVWKVPRIFGEPKDDLNVAVTGSHAYDIPAQARHLVYKLRKLPKKSFDDDWKLVTLWIGGNDLCAACEADDERDFPAPHTKSIEAALDYLQANVPRLFVNVVLVIDVTKLHELDKIGTCKPLHMWLCPCSTSSPEKRERVRGFAAEYQSMVSQLVLQEKYTNSDNFTAVSQPFFSAIEIPVDDEGKPDRSYFAPDCFHFRTKAHEAAAIALWNNMLEPVAAKRTNWVPGEDINCPTADRPYLATVKNTNLGNNLRVITSDAPDAVSDAK